MPFDTKSLLWSGPPETYFQDRLIQPIEQIGPHCVSTVLAMLSGATPERFQGVVNTHDPVSWSDALRDYGLKLASCPHDNRRVKFYAPELVALNDLFTVSYFTPSEPAEVWEDPRPKDGWVCGSHIVILQGGEIIDPARGDRVPALEHRGMEKFTKRIFRVVPANHPRGL